MYSVLMLNTSPDDCIASEVLLFLRDVIAYTDMSVPIDSVKTANYIKQTSKDVRKQAGVIW